jgi:hypothetical protein
LWQVTKNTSKQELPEMDQALPEEQSPPSEKVKDTGNSKSGTKKLGKKDKESKQKEAVAEGDTSQEENNSGESTSEVSGRHWQLLTYLRA